MSTIGDILSGIKKIVLLEETVGRLQRDIEMLAQDVRRVRDYTADVERRVIRIEGMIEGFDRANAAAYRSQLPKD